MTHDGNLGLQPSLHCAADTAQFGEMAVEMDSDEVVRQAEMDDELLTEMAPSSGCSWGPGARPSVSESVHLPEWVLTELSRDEMRLLIAGMHRADGSVASDHKEILTSSARFCDQLMQALLHCGYSVYANLATVDVWRVSWTELGTDSDMDSCSPSMPRQGCITRVPYSRERDGRTWCVQVDHADHLIIAQRAQRDVNGLVTSQSRPIITGNCLQVNERSVPEQYFCFGLNTELLLASGHSRAARDIQVNDMVLDERGQPTPVTGVQRAYQLVPPPAGQEGPANLVNAGIPGLPAVDMYEFEFVDYDLNLGGRATHPPLTVTGDHRMELISNRSVNIIREPRSPRLGIIYMAVWTAASGYLHAVPAATSPTSSSLPTPTCVARTRCRAGRTRRRW